MKKHFLLILMVTLTRVALSQTLEVPKNYVFKTSADYTAANEQVMRCIDWLLQTPAAEQPDQHKEAQTFLLQWLTGTPEVSMEINANILTFMQSSPDLLMIFMSGWAKYALESKDNSKISGNIAGLEAVMDYYKKNNLPNDKNVERFIKMKEKRTLQAYVEKNV